MTYIDSKRAMVDLLERFCDGFTAGDAAAVTATGDIPVASSHATSP